MDKKFKEVAASIECDISRCDNDAKAILAILRHIGALDEVQQRSLPKDIVEWFNSNVDRWDELIASAKQALVQAPEPKVEEPVTLEPEIEEPLIPQTQKEVGEVIVGARSVNHRPGSYIQIFTDVIHRCTPATRKDLLAEMVRCHALNGAVSTTDEHRRTLFESYMSWAVNPKYAGYVHVLLDKSETGMYTINTYPYRRTDA